MLQNLTYELSVLSKSVQHKNLSAAAAHVGLSQPQLSRLVAKIESELGVVLLDRSARRKSGWTPLALDLATVFTRGLGRLHSEIAALTEQRELTELRIGTLEGLAQIAMSFADQCFAKLGMKQIQLDVLDFKDLDPQFMSGNLDLVFTVRPPSKQKYNHLLEVGYQQMEKIETNKSIHVVSPFELTSLDRKDLGESDHIFVSNSLSLRSQWLKEHGGTGILPTDARKGRGKGHYSVYLIGSDLISAKQWTSITDLIL
ncbi:MAG: LysR family transcriptional regulator [Pseudobdellovibrionaceae bacterium]